MTDVWERWRRDNYEADWNRPAGAAAEEPCAIEQFFKDNPDARAVWMTCSCPKCSPRC